MSKKVVFGPPIFSRDTLDFGHAFSNGTHIRVCGRFWLISVQRARKVGGEKGRRYKKKNRGKTKVQRRLFGGLTNLWSTISVAATQFLVEYFLWQFDLPYLRFQGTMTLWFHSQNLCWRVGVCVWSPHLQCSQGFFTLKTLESIMWCGCAFALILRQCPRSICPRSKSKRL